MTDYNKYMTDEREFHIEHFGGGRGGGRGGWHGGTGGKWRGHYGGRVGGYWGGYYGPYYSPYYIGEVAYPYYYYNTAVTPSTPQCVEVGKYDTCNDPYRPVKVALDTHGTGKSDEWRCCTKYM